MSDTPVPPPDCPDAFRVTNLVPMVHVVDVDRSVEFYRLLGFSCRSRFSGHDGVTNWADMVSERAEIMFARAGGPIDPSQQAVLFYHYCPDVMALRMHLLSKGLADGGRPPGEYKPDESLGSMPQTNAVFRPTFPFYMPEGEIRIHDPDGYCILVGQLKK